MQALQDELRNAHYIISHFLNSEDVDMCDAHEIAQMNDALRHIAELDVLLTDIEKIMYSNKIISVQGMNWFMNNWA